MGPMEEGIIAFVARKTSAPLARLSSVTRFREDLGVDGDDGIELMARFAADFGVDLTDFSPAKHFGPEAAWNPFAFLFRPKLKPITIADLVRAAEGKRWTASAETPAKAGV